MPTVFIAGSITIKHLDPKAKERISNAVEADLDVVVGDADGADSAIQRHLQGLSAKRVTVYCSGSQPRNNIGNWPVHHVTSKHAPGSRSFYTAKDVEMAQTADYGLMIWDTKSTGTLSNVIELLTRKKKSVVYIHRDKDFKTVADITHLESLVACMSDHARQKADEKIQLSARIAGLVQEQTGLFA